MSELSDSREQICRLSKSLFDRGLTHGSTGNISVRLSDGSLLVTPTGSSMGFLDADRISHLSASGELLAGAPPTKELPLHTAFYETRQQTGAVVHLHSCYSVALSILSDVDPDNVLQPLTAYGIMLLGKVKLLPFFVPGDPAMGDAVKNLGGKRSAVILANHGPVVAGKDLATAVNATEELEASARLALLLRGAPVNALNAAQTQQIVDRFNVDWT